MPSTPLGWGWVNDRTVIFCGQVLGSIIIIIVIITLVFIFEQISQGFCQLSGENFSFVLQTRQ